MPSTISHMRRAAAVPALVLALVLALLPTAVATAGPADLKEKACSLPREELLRTVRGLRDDRSGDLQVFTRYPDYMGSGLPHVAPFDDIQNVPMVLYGPGHIAAQGTVKRPVYAPDVAPTIAELVDFDGFDAPDGRAMKEALLPESEGPPKLVVTLIWDAAGEVVLDRWPRNYPYLRELMRKGTSYTNASIGSSPASTAQIHASMGTGAFPRSHAIVGHQYRVGEELVSPWKSEAAFPSLPTVADLYDRALGNRPKIAMAGSVGIHLGMASLGAMWGGGDKDIAILREADAGLNPRQTLGAEGIEWRLSPMLSRYFSFPEYANQLGSIADFFGEVDANDGKRDRRWFEEPLNTEDKGSLGGFNTSARVPYQQRLVKEIITREGFGKDDVPDLFFMNYKLIDSRIHTGQGVDGPETGDALRVQDRYLKEFVDFLNDEVGEGEWAMILTADHGATQSLDSTGSFVISTGAVGGQIISEFGADALQFVAHTQIFLDREYLRSRGHTVDDVARFLMTVKKSQVPEVRAATAKEANQPAFRAVIPSETLLDLPCVKER